MKKTAPIVQDELAKLRALARPSDHAKVDLYLEKTDATLKAARELGAAASRGDANAARAAGARAQQLTRQAAALARQLGAQTCATQ